MIVAESRQGRRIVGRLDRGVDLVESLLALCRERRVRTGEVRGLGSLESAEVAAFDQAARGFGPTRKLSGGLELLSLVGNVSERDGTLAVHLHVTLMRDRDAGLEVLGGHLLSARVYAVELCVDAFDDLLLRRAVDPSTGLSVWHEAIELPAGATAAAPGPAPAVTPAPVSTGGATVLPLPPTTWADVVAASAPAAKAPAVTPVPAIRPAPPPAPPADDEDDMLVTAGDVIVHPRFGRCEVQRIEGSQEYAHVRLKNGHLVRLSLEILRLTVAGRENDRRIFNASVDS